MAALSKWVPIGEAPTQSEFDMAKLNKLTTIEKIGGIYCNICRLTFGNKKDYDSHYLNRHGTSTNNIVYTCVVCRKEIVGYPSFRGHCYLQHVTKDKYKCEHCNKVFSKQCILNSHIQSVHKHKCGTCNKEFKNAKDLIIHQALHKNDHGPPYSCGTCGQQIDSTDDCEQHIEDHCNMTYSCPICEETIENIQNAASHLTKHFGDVLIKDQDTDEDELLEIKNDSSIDLLGGIFCCLCDQIYKARPEFDNHYILDHVDKPIMYTCNICGKGYDKYILFASHCYDHYARGRYQCEVCFKSFNRLSLLVTHVEAYHSEKAEKDGMPFTCHTCQHGFMTHRRLKDHLREKHNISYHQCTDKDCQKIFKTPKELSQHLKEHKSTDKFCRTCGLRFSSAAACERHLQVHRKKAYRCPVCDRGYGEKYLVMKHVNQHFSSVLHICKTCGKVYNARSRLNNHMKVHTEEKDHICSYCGKGFTKVYLLKQHINIHTGLRPFSCTVCSKSFASHPNMLKHMKCMHNITKMEKKLSYKPKNTTKIPNPKPNTKIEKIEILENSTEDYDDISKDLYYIPDNNNTRIDVEPAKEPISDMLYDTTAFEDPVEPGWKTVGIDSSVLEMLEENIGNIDAINASANDITELENALWVESPTIPTASPLSFLSEATVVPREYGPEFVNAAPGAAPCGGVVHLDDHLLPHIDPRLTVLAPPAPPAAPAPAPDLQPWEPVLTKVYPEYHDFSDARYSIMNTDIF